MSAAKKHWPVTLACAIMLILCVAALGAEWIAPFHYSAQNPGAAYLSPSVGRHSTGMHLLGTDQLGRDVFSRLIYAIRFSLLIACLGTLIGAVIGTLLGMISAHVGGWLDDGIMALVDIQASLPFMIFALLVLAILGGSLPVFIVLMGIAGWERYARLVRGLVLSANARGYAATIRQFGAGPLRVYGRHILPNIAGPLIVQMTLNFPEILLLETGLSFLGLGVQPPLTSLGRMVSEGREQIFFAWWLVAFPAAMIFVVTLSISLAGDFLRDRIDSTLR